MLEYLITSETRRRLLKLLWIEGASGSVADLARKAGVAFAGAHRELRAMESAGLAKRVGRGARTDYQADKSRPDADLLVKLLQSGDDSGPGNAPEAADLRAELSANGASLDSPALPAAHRPLEEILVDACRFARADASIARVLPVLLAQRNYDLERLLAGTRTIDEKHGLGFFLELAGRFSDDDELVAAAASLRDRRRTKPQPFFPLRSRYERELAELRTPKLAREWGWLMNVGLDGFEDAFRKQAAHGSS